MTALKESRGMVSMGSRSFLRGEFARNRGWGGNHGDSGHLRGDRRETTIFGVLTMD